MKQNAEELTPSQLPGQLSIDGQSHAPKPYKRAYVNSRERSDILKLAVLIGHVEQTLADAPYLELPTERTMLLQAAGLLQSVLDRVCKRQGKAFVRTLLNDASASEILCHTDYKKANGGSMRLTDDMVSLDRVTANRVIQMAAHRCVVCTEPDPQQCDLKRLYEAMDMVPTNRDAERCEFEATEDMDDGTFDCALPNTPE